MSINAYVVTTVTCDACGEHEMDDGIVSNRRQAREARQAARSAGWVHRGGRDLCPECAVREDSRRV